MKPFHAAFSLVVGVVAVGAVSPVLAQSVKSIQSPPEAARPQRPVATVPLVGQSPVVVYQNPNEIPNARNIEEQLRRIMDAYPPSLRVVLQNDPALLQRDDYVAPYPALALFLQQHPEVVRNPSFFLGQPYSER